MKLKSLFRAAIVLAAAVLILAPSTGCPDYSHQRDVPDYENMTDEGGPVDE